MSIEIFPVPEDINEDNFSKYIKKFGWQCMPIRTNDQTLVKLKEVLGVKPRFKLKGCPDFLLYNKERWMFAEFKSLGDTIHPCQLDWYNAYRHFPIAVFYASKDYNGGRI